MIASVNTQNKVEKVDVYYDNSNGIWYLGYDKYPGKLKIEVKPMAEDDFYPVNIVDEKENALIQKEVWDLLQGKIPPEILEILQKANEDSVSLGEKQEAVRKIMGLFNHSVNPLLDELREKSDFLTNAFTYYALHCQGAAMLNAVLSNALGIPLEVWEGYRVSSEDGNLYTPGHAYNRGENGGIEDAVQQLDENSLLYALKGVLPEDWGKELKYLQQRADGIREKFSAQNQEKAIKARNQELEQKMAEMEKALQKQGEDYDGQEEVYKEKIEKLKKLRLDYASWEKLVAWAGAIDFSESKSSKELFAKRGYVLEVLTLAAYNEPSLFRKIQSVEESLYSNFILFLQDNKNFIPDTEIDLTEKDGMPYVGFAYLGEKKVVFDFLTGKKILELKIPATPEQYRLDTYVQGHIPRSAYPYNGILPDGDWLAYNPIGEAEGSWIDKNKVLFKNVKHVKEAFSSPKGEVILEVEFNNGSYGIIGPWAEKYGLSGEEYKTAPPKIHFYPIVVVDGICGMRIKREISVRQ